MALTRIKTGGITDNAITNAKIADDAIDSDDFADGSIDNEHLAGSIATSKLTGALTSVGSHGLAASATTDTTSASNISSGTLAAARVATLNQNTTGSAATVTTNANLTGHVTSSGNAAVLGSFTVAQLSSALSNASISGNNTGDQTLPTRASLNIDTDDAVTFAGITGTTGTFSGDIHLSDTTNHIRTTTSNASDNADLRLGSAGDLGSDRGAGIDLYGNENANTGKVNIYTGNVTGGDITFQTGNSTRLTITKAGNATFTGTIGSGAITSTAGIIATSYNLSSSGTFDWTLRNSGSTLEFYENQVAGAVGLSVTQSGHGTFRAGLTIGGNFIASGTGSHTFAGNVRTGTSVETANTNFDNLVIEGTSHTGITIYSGVGGSDSDGGIYFGDDDANNRGQIKYHHSSDAMSFATADGAASLTLDSGLNATFAGTITNAPSTDGAYAMFVNQQHATGWGLRIAGGADSSDNLINAQNGSGAEKFVVKSDGSATFAGGVTAFTLTATDAIYAQDNINLSATKNLYFDGGSNSYMTEYAGDQVKMVCGTQNAMFWRDNNTTIPKDAKLFFDGTSTGVGSTYIWCDNTDELQFNMGGTLALTIDPSSATFTGQLNANGGFERRLDHNAGTNMALNNQNSGTGAYSEMYIKNNDRQLVMGCSKNYASGQWNGGWVYASSGNLMLKSPYADVEIFAGGDTDAYRALILDSSLNATFAGSIYLPSGGRIHLTGSTTNPAVDGGYGIENNHGYFDTLNSGADSDPLELVYSRGTHVRIGTGQYGSKALYASVLYQAGKQVIATDGGTITTSSAPGLTVDVGLPSSANREIVRFAAASARPICLGWIDSGSKMTMFTPGTHSIVLGAGAIGTNHLEIASSGASTFAGSVTSAGYTLGDGNQIFWNTGSNSDSRAWRIKSDNSSYGMLDIGLSNANDNTIDTTAIQINRSGEAIFAKNATFAGSVSVDGALTLTGGNATMTFSNTDQISHLQLNTPDGGSMKGGISIGGGSSSTQAQSHWQTVRNYHPWSGFTDYDTAIWTSSSSANYGALLFGTRDAKAIKIYTDQTTEFYGNVGINTVHGGYALRGTGDFYWSGNNAYWSMSGMHKNTSNGWRQFVALDENVTFGSVSKTSGSFRIPHPLPSKKDTHDLVHSFVEAPKADLIYRGQVQLEGGSATVNIDTHAGMTEGTFVVLCDDVQCFTTNESDWDAVKGSVSENILTIQCKNSSSTASISWMVIGDRKDETIVNAPWTDENGKPIIEPEQIVVEIPEGAPEA